MSRSVAVLALYALVDGAVVAAFASLYVPVLAAWGPVGLLLANGVVTFLLGIGVAFLYELRLEPGQDTEDVASERARVLLVPFALAVVASAPAILVPDYALVARTAFEGVSATVVEPLVPTLALAVVVGVALPAAVRHSAWQRLDAVGLESTELEVEDVTDSPGPNVAARLDVGVLDRLELATLDGETPAVYLVDDGRRAVVGFTTGALDVLSPREREALLAREVARVVERTAVPQFWAGALAAAADHVLEPVTTDAYDARAGGKVRLPYWVVGPLKTATGLAALFVFAGFHVWALASSLPVGALSLTAAYAVGTLAVAFWVARVATRVADWSGTTQVTAADRHGALLAGDATTLISALQKLDDANRPRDDAAADAEDDVGALDVLADCPTDRVPLQQRVDALEAVAERLEDRGRPQSTAGNASS